MKTFNEYLTEALQTAKNNTVYTTVDKAKKHFKGKPEYTLRTKDGNSFVHQSAIDKKQLLNKLEEYENKKYVTKGPYSFEINSFKVAQGEYEEIKSFIEKEL